MKIILLIFSLAISASTVAMQPKPNTPQWPAELPEIWDFAVKANLRRLKLIEKQIKQIAPQYVVIRDGREVLVHAQDSRENILRNFRGMPWFSAQSLTLAEYFSGPTEE
jgi:hypothetical protein